MWVEANLSISDKMGVEVDKVVTLHRVSEFEHSYTTGMDVEVSDLKPHLNCNVVIDFMEELVPLSWGEVTCPLHYCNGAVFMTFGETPLDVHPLSCSLMRTPIFNEHRRRNEGGRVDGEVRHDRQAAR